MRLRCPFSSTLSYRAAMAWRCGRVQAQALLVLVRQCARVPMCGNYAACSTRQIESSACESERAATSFCIHVELRLRFASVRLSYAPVSLTFASPRSRAPHTQAASILPVTVNIPQARSLPVRSGNCHSIASTCSPKQFSVASNVSIQFVYRMSC